MTARQLYEGVLIELNKENAPNLLLEDFNYFANKAVNNYVNKRYNIYDVNQQTTDDLRVLKATAILKPTKVTDYAGMTMAGDGAMATYEVIMPSDYLHILNCICIYKVNKTYKCYNAGDTWRSAATRLTADMYSQVLDNFWNKPTYKRPYYYIHNVNTGTGVDTWKNPVSTTNGSDRDQITYATVPTNTKTDEIPRNSYNNIALGTDGNNNPVVTAETKGKSLLIGGLNASNVERGAGVRYGNVSEVRLEIRYGTDNSVFELSDVYVDYIKAP
jgi:hypothetical protein